MGLLDEAIREHLELKRRRGADPREVAQQEKDALGPVDREAYREEARAAAVATEEAPEDVAAEMPLDEPVAPAVDEDDFEYEADLPEDDLGWEEEEDGDDATRMMDAPAAQDDAPPAHEVPPAHEAPSAHDAPRPTEPPASPDVPAAGEAPPPAGGIDQPTAAYSLDDLEGFEDDAPRHEPRDVVPADEEPGDGDGDVLEETPDFLEETPEHDRLWFEQKPPRDFDF